MTLPPLATVVLLSLVVGCAGGTAGTRARSLQDASTVDALFRDYSGLERPGASVVVIHDGKVVLRRAYGLADLEKQVPATPETNYRLASLTKQFTATAILLLVQDRKLRLDDHVVDVLPGFPASLKDVRVHHLLQHTSGIWDYEDFVPATQTVQVKDRDVLELLNRTERTYFAPGTAVRYSNSGYAVLALLVQQVSGMPFAQFLHERVFVPSGMRSSVAHEDGVSTVVRRAYGYAVTRDGFPPRDQSPTSAVLGDGGVYSSVDDLVAWDRTLDSHALVGKELQEQAWTSPRLQGGTPSRYGFGWFVDNDGGRRRLSHHGETSGFTNAIVKYPDHRLTVIVLTNRAGGEPWTLAQYIADQWLGPPANPGSTWPFVTVPNAH
ncbi:serine hydrolase [Corallococcus sp. CA053C]|uniref:serine hydrolase domain-containing protein n=1 Tax=Corallococcus sp. CA053C TaxID=2316732 RepID=UPI001F1E9D11|nr:serine hydrolase domain-containing protein [Corallococcus sp. CA053C]